MTASDPTPDNRIARLKEATIEHYRVGGGTRPDVLLINPSDGRRQVLKDFGACDPWFAKGIGWMLAHRECRALVQLADVPGVPRLIERIGARAYLLEYAPASPIMKVYQQCLTPSDAGLDAMPDWEAFLLRLGALIDTMHNYGVTHGDLRSPHNVLIGPSGEPWLVDFVSVSFRARWWTLPISWPLNLMHNKLKQVDRSAVDKYRRRLSQTPQGDASSLPAHVEQPYAHESRVDRAWRQLGVSIRNLARRLLTRERNL